MLKFILITIITILLISTISLPLHVYFRKLSFRNTIADIKFWIFTLSISILVAVITNLEN